MSEPTPARRAAESDAEPYVRLDDGKRLWIRGEQVVAEDGIYYPAALRANKFRPLSPDDLGMREGAYCPSIAAALRAENTELKAQLAVCRDTMLNAAKEFEPLATAFKKRGDKLQAERDKALSFIADQGYRRCDIPACNCGSWHGGNASQRLREISSALDDAGCEPLRKTALVAVCELAQERDDLRERLAAYEARDAANRQRGKCGPLGGEGKP